MDQGSLVEAHTEAAAQFLREFDKSMPTVVAFWVKEDENGGAKLYVAPDRLDNKHRRAAYGEVLRIAKSLSEPGFDPFQVTLVPLSDPLAQAALETYKERSPMVPFHFRERGFGGRNVEEIYFVKGPTGDYTMPSGREILNEIIDKEAEFFTQHGKPPKKLKLPVLKAYDLAKCGRNELGDLSGRVFMDGITVFEKEGFHGMKVEIVRDRDAQLELE